MSFHHIPVLLAECIDGLAIRPDGIYLDGTAGGAGHSKEIAARLTTGRLIALDQDPDAVAAASQRLEGLPATVVQSNFRYADRALAQLGVDGLDGVLLDLGVSSHQLDEVSRGFSYQGDAPLDMRMSQSGPTAADLVNTASRAELCRILKEYGEEPYAWQIAGKIESARAAAPIETTAQLVQAVAHWRNRCLTSLSSREWNVMTHMRPPGFSAANSTSSPSLSASSSPFTAMRSAWKVRRAGFLS